eukprot:363758-Chlamydomonas_euryale.AAC.11
MFSTVPRAAWWDDASHVMQCVERRSWSAVHGALCMGALHGVQVIKRCAWGAVHGLQSMEGSAWRTVHGAQCMEALVTFQRSGCGPLRVKHSG